MRILGIDPGLAIVGWGLLDYQGGRFSVVDFGAVRTPAHTKTEDRLLSIYEQIGQILDIGEGTVKSRLSRARKNLAKLLRERNIF